MITGKIARYRKNLEKALLDKVYDKNVFFRGNEL